MKLDTVLSKNTYQFELFEMVLLIIFSFIYASIYEFILQ